MNVTNDRLLNDDSASFVDHSRQNSLPRRAVGPTGLPRDESIDRDLALIERQLIEEDFESRHNRGGAADGGSSRGTPTRGRKKKKKKRGSRLRTRTILNDKNNAIANEAGLSRISVHLDSENG